MIDERVPAEWIRGVLPLLVLAVLSESDAHGYLIAQRLSEVGFGPIKGGVLYPVLNRLASEGAIRAQWVAGEGGPGRKSFSLADAGRKRLGTLSPLWSQFTETAERFLESPGTCADSPGGSV